MYTTAVPRLLFVTGTAQDVRGGSGTYVGTSILVAALRAAGHAVVVLAPKPGPDPVSLARRVAFNLAARGRAGSAGRFDAVVGVDRDGVFLPRDDGRGRFAVAVKGGIADEARFERGLARLRLAFESVLERWNVRRAGVVIGPSRYAANRIAEDYGVEAGRIRVVPEPIDLARWEAAFASARTGDARDRGGSGGRILCVAHLYPRKDVATLVEALPGVPGARLTIVGDGPERPRIQARARELGLLDGRRVELLGHVPFERLAAELRSADVFCLPSLQEGFGIVFLEAMAAGLPIVAARAGAVPETVPDGECGILAPPGDPVALASALSTLLPDAALRRRMGEAGSQRVRQFDAPLVATRFLEALGLG
jgi:glycosyltransferase involved in cell wall biosynthesis